MSTPFGSSERRTSLVLPFSNTFGALGLIAWSGVASAGNISYSTVIRRTASSAISSVTPATAAISSPWYQTVLFGVAGSLSAMAAFTPGNRCAADRSTLLIAACGCGELSSRAYSMPGRLMSEAYFAFPCALSGPSIRLIERPSSVRSAVEGQLRVGPAGCGGAGLAGGCWLSTRHRLRIQGRFEHAHVGAAAADVAVERLFRLLARRLRVLLEERDRRGHEAGRAEAAHEAVVLAERLLDRVHRRAFGQPLDRADPLPLHLDGKCRAGIEGLAVH